MMKSENQEGSNMNDDQQADKELGYTLKRMRGDRMDATKDLYFETDPQTAALRYRYDPRSMEILGAAKWQELFGSED
jgi:hypothetical protein